MLILITFLGVFTTVFMSLGLLSFLSSEVINLWSYRILNNSFKDKDTLSVLLRRFSTNLFSLHSTIRSLYLLLNFFWLFYFPISYNFLRYLSLFWLTRAFISDSESIVLKLSIELFTIFEISLKLLGIKHTSLFYSSWKSACHRTILILFLCFSDFWIKLTLFLEFSQNLTCLWIFSF